MFLKEKRKDSLDFYSLVLLFSYEKEEKEKGEFLESFGQSFGLGFEVAVSLFEVGVADGEEGFC